MVLLDSLRIFALDLDYPQDNFAVELLKDLPSHNQGTLVNDKQFHMINTFKQDRQNIQDENK